jgi:hypothetical protein
MTGATTAVLAQSKTPARPQRETTYQQNSNPPGTGDAKRDLNQNPTLRLTGNQASELDRGTGISEPQAIDLREASMGRSPFAIATNFMLHVAPVNELRLIYPAEFPAAESGGNGSGDSSHEAAISSLVMDTKYALDLFEHTVGRIFQDAGRYWHNRITASRGPGLGSAYEDGRRGKIVLHPPGWRRLAA